MKKLGEEKIFAQNVRKLYYIVINISEHNHSAKNFPGGNSRDFMEGTLGRKLSAGSLQEEIYG